MKIYPIMLNIVAHYLNRIWSFFNYRLCYALCRYSFCTMQIFLLIWIIIHINYYGLTQHYSLIRVCFGERAIVTYFRSLRTLAFFAKYVNQSARCIKVSFKPRESFCKMPRTNDSNRQNKSVGSFLSKFWKKKNCPNQLLWYIDFETKHETIFLQC